MRTLILASLFALLLAIAGPARAQTYYYVQAPCATGTCPQAYYQQPVYRQPVYRQQRLAQLDLAAASALGR
jgi:hypothetical protein